MPIDDSLTFLSVFAAGILSFASPCVVPLLPVYASILTNAAEDGKRRVWLNSACFFGGFALVFTLMGASASYLGRIFFDNQPLLRQIGAVFIVLMGLHLAGVITIPLLFREYRPLLRGVFHGSAGAFLLGIAFTVGWTPCIGPVLAGVLVYAGSSDTLSRGIWLLFIYALGFCLPFLIAAATLNKWLPKYQKFFGCLPQIQRIFGGLLIVTGVLIYFDLVNKLIGVLWSL